MCASDKNSGNDKQNKSGIPEDRTMERLHNPALGQVWTALTGQIPQNIISQIVATVLEEGGTRPPWRWTLNNTEYMALAWPQDQPVRACVLLAGPKDGQLKPVSVVPLLEGLPNDLCVEEIHPLPEGDGANVAVSMIEDKNPMWFFDPFYTRDKNDLTPGITHTFWLSAAALGIRKAVLDQISLTSGPDYELHAQKWLAEHPERKSMDVPPLKIDIAGKHFIMPGRFFGEYQLRAVVEDIEEWQLDKMPIQVLYLTFPFDNRPNLRLPLYVSKFVSGNYQVEKGHDIEAYVWLEGRIIDLESTAQGSE